jgi:stage V sporulation protein G
MSHIFAPFMKGPFFIQHSAFLIHHFFPEVPMKLTEIRINLCPGPHGLPQASTNRNSQAGQRLRAFCSLTFDNTFVIHDVKLIDGNGGLFLAMPSRKLSDHCPACGEKNHLRARFCNECGRRLDEDRAGHQPHDRGTAAGQGPGAARLKLHADIVHPINAASRRQIENHVFQAYWSEVDRSTQPGYVPLAQSSLDRPDGYGEDIAAVVSNTVM